MYRSAPHSTTKESPASLVFKKAPITRFSFLHACLGEMHQIIRKKLLILLCLYANCSLSFDISLISNHNL